MIVWHLKFHKNLKVRYHYLAKLKETIVDHGYSKPNSEGISGASTATYPAAYGQFQQALAQHAATIIPTTTAQKEGKSHTHNH